MVCNFVCNGKETLITRKIGIEKFSVRIRHNDKLKAQLKKKYRNYTQESEKFE